MHLTCHQTTDTTPDTCITVLTLHDLPNFTPGWMRAIEVMTRSGMQICSMISWQHSCHGALVSTGVAPRAKMNQQRSRRFKSAEERKQVCASTSMIRHCTPMLTPSEEVFEQFCLLAELGVHSGPLSGLVLLGTRCTTCPTPACIIRYAWLIDGRTARNRRNTCAHMAIPTRIFRS